MRAAGLARSSVKAGVNRSVPAGPNLRRGSKGVILYVGRNTGFPRGVDGLPDQRRPADLILPQL